MIKTGKNGFLDKGWLTLTLIIAVSVIAVGLHCASGEAKNTPSTKNILRGDAQKHFQQGQVLLGERKLDKAAKKFCKVIKLSPRSPVGHFWLGMTYFQKKELDRAIGEFQKVLEVDPKNYQGYSMLGKLLFLQKKNLKVSLGMPCITLSWAEYLSV